MDSYRLPEKALSWDRDRQVIMPGDTVQVVQEEYLRKGNPKYLFCAKGAQGKAVKIGRLRSVLSQEIIVEFLTDDKEQKIVGCADIHLRKV